jgi:hypothetical protein
MSPLVLGKAWDGPYLIQEADLNTLAYENFSPTAAKHAANRNGATPLWFQDSWAIVPA